MKIRETYINATEGHGIGDSGWYEPWMETRGEVFRYALKEWGRCKSRIYRDVRVSTPFTAFGVSVPARFRAEEVGWVFSRLEVYEDAGYPRTDADYYTREVRVEVREDDSETSG